MKREAVAEWWCQRHRKRPLGRVGRDETTFSGIGSVKPVEGRKCPTRGTDCAHSDLSAGPRLAVTFKDSPPSCCCGCFCCTLADRAISVCPNFYQIKVLPFTFKPTVHVATGAMNTSSIDIDVAAEKSSASPSALFAHEICYSSTCFNNALSTARHAFASSILGVYIYLYPRGPNTSL